MCTETFQTSLAGIKYRIARPCQKEELDDVMKKRETKTNRLFNEGEMNLYRFPSPTGAAHMWGQTNEVGRPGFALSILPEDG
ncbi:hypothetical protein AVEN_228281-1 [Araneus ventricosus]|uniref:Uncharacterized protein n=1 Tax=Araneus ventricosus TaxID=182803 RepID=A0A4Y2ECP7_ARAVE|nr:hypothetical protein AVEN_228281-1 [Araneus ventricosus]